MASARLFVNEKTIKKDGTVTIYALVHISNKSVKIKTGVSIPLAKFDKNKGRVRGNSKTDKDNNLIIDKCLGLINDILVRYRLQQKPLTADLLLREYKNPSLFLDFYAFMDQRLKDRVKAKEISPVSGKHQRVTLNKLEEFKPTLNFAEIDLRFINRFRRWLASTKENDVNTIQKTMSYFNTYMNIARREEIINSNPFDSIIFRRVTPNRVYLSELEFKKLIEYYDKKTYSTRLHRTLRHFLFMCLTGIRISDFIRLTKDNVHENALKFVPHKTNSKKRTEITVPLIDKARELINDENSIYPELFVTIAEQKMNLALKEITDQAAIEKKITNHSARHTFATLFLEKTSDVATLQLILGHSNIKETMVYVHLSTRKITEQMGNFDRLLSL